VGMADFALWVAAGETGFRPEVAFAAAYSNNRREAIENIVEADPVAARMRWPTERNGPEPHPIFCRPAPISPVSSRYRTGPAGQRAPAHSLAGYAELRPFSGHLGLRLASTAWADWARGQSV
jgi:hypothetical protein